MYAYIRSIRTFLKVEDTSNYEYVITKINQNSWTRILDINMQEIYRNIKMHSNLNKTIAPQMNSS